MHARYMGDRSMNPVLVQLADVKRQLVRVTPKGRRRYRRHFILSNFPKRSVGAEIGVFRGEYSAKILDIVQPERLHLIDPWLYDPKVLPSGTLIRNQQDVDDVFTFVSDRFSSQIQDGQVTLHRMTSEEASSSFDDCSLDWVYIDGNHEYEFVRLDLELYAPKVKVGGFIAGDDYRDDKYGVKSAVDEFCKRKAIEFKLGRDTQFLLTKHAD